MQDNDKTSADNMKLKPEQHTCRLITLFLVVAVISASLHYSSSSLNQGWSELLPPLPPVNPLVIISRTTVVAVDRKQSYVVRVAKRKTLRTSKNATFFVSTLTLSNRHSINAVVGSASE